MKKRDDIAESLADAIDPHMQKFAITVTEMLREHVEAKLEAATTFALDRLRAELAGEVAVEFKVVESEDPPAPTIDEFVAPTRRDAIAERATAVPGKRRCTKCRETGHRADRCTNAPVAVGAAKTVDTPPPLLARTTRSDRFARIEAAARARASGE